jgi:hypothetical protein
VRGCAPQLPPRTGAAARFASRPERPASRVPASSHGAQPADHSNRHGHKELIRTTTPATTTPTDPAVRALAAGAGLCGRGKLAPLLPARLPGCGHAWADVRPERQRLRLWSRPTAAGRVSGGCARKNEVLSSRHVCLDVVTPGQMCGGNDNVFGCGPGLWRPVGWVVVVWVQEVGSSGWHICPGVVTPGQVCGGNENVFGCRLCVDEEPQRAAVSSTRSWEVVPEM